MELIVISDSKLKIMLTKEDLREYALDCNTLDYENTETRRAFWSILDEAKHRTGFDAASEKVFVQVYPSRAGGCEMYVTKLGIFADKAFRRGEGKGGDEDDDVLISTPLHKKKGGSDIRGRTYVSDDKVLAVENNRLEAFRFEKMDFLLLACRRLCAVGYSEDSSAYQGEGAWYLILREKSTKSMSNRFTAGRFIREYAKELDPAALGIYIGEHGKCICEHGAVEKLGVL